MMKEKDSDITDKEFQKYIAPFYDNVNDYIINYVVPEVIAFQLSNFYYRGCLKFDKSSLLQHYNSMMNVFNISLNFEEVKEEIEKILKIKYNLKIVNEEPLRFEMWNK